MRSRTPAPSHRRRTGAPFRLLGAVAVAASLAWAAPATGQDGADGGIAVGATPEPVVLETLDGEPVDLGGIVGNRPVLLEFWATWCAVCRALEPAMQAAHEAYGERVEFVVVAAAVAQTQDRVKQHIARHPVPGRILWDTRGQATRAFDAPGTGFIVILDENGTVAYTGTGARQDLVAALGSVVDR
jgi:thiol-disulfide isomerase/thioredoxin